MKRYFFIFLILCAKPIHSMKKQKPPLNLFNLEGTHSPEQLQTLKEKTDAITHTFFSLSYLACFRIARELAEQDKKNESAHRLMQHDPMKNFNHLIYVQRSASPETVKAATTEFTSVTEHMHKTNARLIRNKIESFMNEHTHKFPEDEHYLKTAFENAELRAQQKITECLALLLITEKQKQMDLLKKYIESCLQLAQPTTKPGKCTLL